MSQISINLMSWFQLYCLSINHLLSPVCKNLDFVTGEFCPPLLLNFPWSANTYFYCCIFSSFIILKNFVFKRFSSLNLSFVCSSLPVLIRFCKFAISAACLALRVFKAVSIFTSLFWSHCDFYDFYNSRILCCTLWAST